MQYLKTIGKNSKKAFENLKAVKHSKIKTVLDAYNKELLKNKNKIIKEAKDGSKTGSRKSEQTRTWPPMTKLSSTGNGKDHERILTTHHKKGATTRLGCTISAKGGTLTALA